jgi:hypothetical protein
MARIMRSTGAGGKAHALGREMARPMTRSAWAAAVVLLLGVACASDAVPPAAPNSGSPPPLLPDSALSRMTSETTSVDADDIANEVAHPDEMRALLADAGFMWAAQRSFGGGTGAFSRVLARGLTFDDEAGAAAFVAWFAEHASAEIITAERVDPAGAPDGIVVFRHLPDGCCHNDVPVFLAAWQRGSSVLFLHVGGRRANARAFVELISTYDQEV